MHNNSYLVVYPDWSGMSAKQQRQLAIRRLVRQSAVSNQSELVGLLEKAGISGTQASVSRDIRELGLIKVNGRYCMPGARSASAPAAGTSELITDLVPVGANLVVISTAVAAASAVAAELDRLALADIVGTIAGDDTIFVAVRSRAAQGRTMHALRHMRLAPAAHATQA